MSRVQIVLNVPASRVFPLVSNPGLVMLTSKRVYFMPYNNVDSEPVKKFRLCDISRVVKRRYLLCNVGIECFLGESKRLFLRFEARALRDSFYEALIQQAELNLQASDQGNMMLMWQNGALSNYDYLMYLNSMADRSVNDLTQYPVFPVRGAAPPPTPHLLFFC